MAESIRQQIIGAGVWQANHIQLNSGKHSEVKLDMERLAHNRPALMGVMGGIANILFEQNAVAVVPVPNGALKLARVSFPLAFPLTLPSEKLGTREFGFAQQPWTEAVIRKAGRLAIFEDVVTTGDSSAAMAKTVRAINPDVELDLVGIWRRDTLSYEAAGHFASQTYLVEEPIPAWPAEECRCQAD